MSPQYGYIARIEFLTLCNLCICGQFAVSRINYSGQQAIGQLVILVAIQQDRQHWQGRLRLQWLPRLLPLLRHWWQGVVQGQAPSHALESADSEKLEARPRCPIRADRREE